MRYVGNSCCTECCIEASRKYYASLELTPAQKITTLLGEVARLKDESEVLRSQNNEFRRNAGSMSLGGFGDAFYKVAERLGITGARPDSPMQVFASEILPALDAVIRDADRLHKAKTFVQKLSDSAGSQPSVATGYLRDILSVMSSGDQP